MSYCLAACWRRKALESLLPSIRRMGSRHRAEGVTQLARSACCSSLHGQPRWCTRAFARLRPPLLAWRGGGAAKSPFRRREDVRHAVVAMCASQFSCWGLSSTSGYMEKTAQHWGQYRGDRGVLRELARVSEEMLVAQPDELKGENSAPAPHPASCVDRRDLHHLDEEEATMGGRRPRTSSPSTGAWRPEEREVAAQEVRPNHRYDPLQQVHPVRG